MDARTDAELLHALRRGDKQAYATLWKRHFPAARRYAERMFPSRADDLISESFLAIYQQVTTTDTGPQFAFRSYLKAVMRNTAIRWSKEAERIELTEELGTIEGRDALSLAERDADAGDVLRALQALPERWQRVLWLAEVAEASRTEIARELKIKPNAVSALQRRARLGLKRQWLTLQVPPALREDPSHAARLFPQYLTDPADRAVSAEVNLHIADCASCRTLLRDTRGAAALVGGRSLAVLLGTAGIGTATATLSSATTASALALTAGAGALTWLIGGGTAAVTAGSLFLSSLLPAGPALAGPEPQPSHAETPAQRAEPPADSRPLPSTADAPPQGEPAAPAVVPGQPDPRDQALGLTDDPSTYFPGYPSRPKPATGVPDPSPDPGPQPSPSPSETPAPGGGTRPLSPGLTSPVSSTAYLPPVITGTTTPGSGVAVEVDGDRYTPAVASDGTWRLDLRGYELAPGDYPYRAWAFTETASSPAVDGSFTVLPIEVRGFENVTGFEDLTVTEARTTGLIVEFFGPPNGVIWTQTMETHSALIALDANGYARRRLLVDSYGWYWFTIRYLDDDGYWSSGWEHNLDVYDPAMPYDPMGPDPEEMTYRFVAP